MARRLQGKSRWRLQISSQISAAEGGGGRAAKGELSGTTALVASSNQRVPVHGAGCQRLRLLSSLFPLMSVSFSPRCGRVSLQTFRVYPGICHLFGLQIQVNSFIFVKAAWRKVGEMGLTCCRCISPTPNMVLLSSRMLRASKVTSHICAQIETGTFV